MAKNLIITNSDTGQAIGVAESATCKAVDSSNVLSYGKFVSTIRVPKVIAKIKICGGGLTIAITDDMEFEIPTEEQRENLKKYFGIEIELVEEE